MVYTSGLVRDWEVHQRALADAFSVYVRRKAAVESLRGPKGSAAQQQRIPGRKHEANVKEAEAMVVEAMDVLYTIENALDRKLEEMEICLRETEKALASSEWIHGPWAGKSEEDAQGSEATKEEEGGENEEHTAITDHSASVCHLAIANIVEASRNEQDTLKVILHSTRQSGPARATLQTYLMVIEERGFGEQLSLLKEAKDLLADDGNNL